MCGGCKLQVSFLWRIQNSNTSVLSQIHTDSDTSLAHGSTQKNSLHIHHPRTSIHSSFISSLKSTCCEKWGCGEITSQRGWTNRWENLPQSFPITQEKGKWTGKKSSLVFFNPCMYMLIQLCLAQQCSPLNSFLLYMQFTYPWPTQLLCFCMHWPEHSGQYFHKSV